MKKLSVLSLLLSLALCTPLAQGAIQLSFSLDGGAAVICDSDPVSSATLNCGAASVGDVSINSATATSNSPGGPVDANVFQATLQIQTTLAHTLEIWVAAQDFTFPTAPPAV